MEVAPRLAVAPWRQCAGLPYGATIRAIPGGCLVERGKRPVAQIRLVGAQASTRDRRCAAWAMMIGVERSMRTAAPTLRYYGACCRLPRARTLLLLNCGSYDNVVRFIHRWWPTGSSAAGSAGSLRTLTSWD
jgi:hypothetical protein